MQDFIKRNLFHIVSIFLLFLYFVILSFYTIKTPFHGDSLAPLISAKNFWDTFQFNSMWDVRVMIEVSVLPFYYFFEENALFAAILFYSFSFSILYYFAICKYFGESVAILSSFLVLSMASSLITIGHIKEDFVSIFFLMLALYSVVILKKRWLQILVSSFLLFLAILTKEIVLAFVPFFFMFLYIEKFYKYNNKFFDKNSILSFLISSFFIIIFILLLMLIFNFDYLVSFYSQIGNPNQAGVFRIRSFAFILDIFTKSMGSLLLFAHVLIPLSLLGLNKYKKLLISLLILQLGVVFFALVLNSSAHYKNLMWFGMLSFPLIILGFKQFVLLCSQYIKTTIFVVFSCIIFLNVWNIFPVLKYRSSYHSIKNFYSNIPFDKNSSILLGMDNCGLATYYSGMKCTRHVVNPSIKEAIAYRNMLMTKYINKGKNIYLLPDFYAYDRYRNLKRVIMYDFELEEAYSNPYEDYHAVSMGVDREQVRQRTERLGCVISDMEKEPSDIPGIDLHIFNAICGDYKKRFIYYGVMNRVFPSLSYRTITRLIPKYF